MRKIDQALDGQRRVIPIQRLAEEFFQLINPKTKKGEFKKKESVIGRLKGRIIGHSKLPSRFYEGLLDEGNNFKMLRQIVTSAPSEMEQRVMPEIEQLRHSCGFSWTKARRKEVITTLGYPLIRKNYTNWLVDRLGIKACPYCGTQYILGFSSQKEKKVLCELDHFFPKEEYPYLCISFYNLVPSCSPCNRLKSSGGTSLASYPHPYIDDLNMMFTFKTNPAGVIRSIIAQRKNIPITLEPMGTNTRKIDNYLKRFRLAEVYPNHSDVAEEIYWKKYVYNKSRKKELTKLFKGKLGLTQKEIDRFIIGNYTADEDLLKRPLAKLTKDIAREIKLIP